MRNDHIEGSEPSVERLRPILDVSPDALVLVDSQGRIVLINRYAEHLFGFASGELTGQPVEALLPQRFRERHGSLREQFLAAPRQRAMGSGVELFAQRKDGSEFPVDIMLSPLPPEFGAVVGASVRDISESYRIVGQLRESQEYNRGLIESNIDALMTTDPLGIISDVNKQMCAITGCPREALIGTPFKTYFTDPARAVAGIRKVLQEDKVTNYELTVRARDGRETVVSYNATTFKSADGRLRGVFAAARDITEQKGLESQITLRNQELTETTGFLNNVLESSTEYSIIAKDLKGNILTWNEGARRNYGYSAEDMVGKGNTSLLHVPEDIASGRVQALFDQALSTGKAEGVFERRRKDGRRFTASVSMTLRRDAAGKPIGFLLISKDITEQKQLEEQLRRKNEVREEQYRRVQEANRLKSEFLANMSHELRTPLNAIIGFSEIMHDGKAGALAPEHKEFIGDILTSARHLLQLINDVLDLAKVEAGKMEFAPEPIDLAKLVGEVRDVVRTLMARRRIKLSIAIDSALRDVVADPGKLKQVLYNYLSNALKFSHEGGEVIVRARPEGADRFRIEVEDHGIGIRPEDLGRLFVEFQQLDASIAKKYQGTGLGLALTRRIVEAQGGEVGVHSEPGRGSVFFCVLPRQALGGPLAGLAQPPPGRAAAARVLVVEDDPGERSALAAALAAAGYQVDVAANGASALGRCRERRYAALILDLLLPDQTGWDVLRALRYIPQHARTPVVVASVVADQAGGSAPTVQDYLVKPVAPEALIAALHRAGVTPDLSGAPAQLTRAEGA